MDSESRSESALNSPTEPDVSLAASLTDPLEAHTLDEARRTIRLFSFISRDLRMKYRAQAHQLLTWRRAHRTQEELVTRLQREKAEQLKSLSSQLLLFESRLVRKQKEITNMLALRETIIMKQQKVIETLQTKLLDNGIDTSQTIPDFRDMLQDSHITGDFDSLNDSDSAVIMEDIDSDCSNLPHVPRFRSANPDSVTIVRSISDAIDPNLKYSVVRRSNGFLRRPEILETVYSVEEEADGDSTKGLSAQNSTEKELKDANKTDEQKYKETSLLAQRRDNFRMRSVVLTAEVKSIDNDKDTKSKSNNEIWSYSYVPKRMMPPNDSDEEVTSNPESDEGETEQKTNQVVTYNRVMSNHRNVTKPKDVKYKRINKAKSKSLEELRGRLKNWVDKGNKLSDMPLEHAQSYA
ncbi:uncharacterized protein LOC113404460 isoform X1 [Vanessa tameamea]|uniref:Uncharacterized protein LOC113404460 isoform X1 n=1 Tax=Vanessa tameamea TaxID=334116 RepID=A0A8B8IVG4_VANTA|nr:uncharacterized protein LOC113404460 isoform X1 [Vanessa tameamea]XP_047542044.1 uncharacterized protein LOC125074693 isoform X1 [Vanessa atalanta]XP_047542053.1 uncharacterized protein LOC125074693 isoform X1 [Vanessa atalanta]XP_047542061.1 uncharacterized protein LOC125074693 isoform X1 [Vanessa atalanta]